MAVIHDTCQEDEEFFESRQDAETMDKAINKFMDGMEAQEHGGLEGGFLPSMNEEEQRRFMPAELWVLLYKHALEYRYKRVDSSTSLNILVHTKNEQVHTQYISSTCKNTPKVYKYYTP